jgi:hypothetical protein
MERAVISTMDFTSHSSKLTGIFSNHILSENFNHHLGVGLLNPEPVRRGLFSFSSFARKLTSRLVDTRCARTQAVYSPFPSSHTTTLQWQKMPIQTDTYSTELMRLMRIGPNSRPESGQGPEGDLGEQRNLRHVGPEPVEPTSENKRSRPRAPRT